MASEVSIANLALQKLGAERITSLTQDHPNARHINNCFAHIRDSEIRKRSWGFARKFVQLPAATVAPIFSYTNAFALPSDCIRILPPRDATCDWRVVGRYIYTDWGAPLDLEYLHQVTDPNQMDVLFQEALACRIAWHCCEAITQSNQKKADTMTEYKAAIAEARQANAFENISDEPPEDVWVSVRRT